MTTGRRLFGYALAYKKIIIAALVMLTISVVTDLAGPFIAKKVIDQHILGIESKWYVSKKGANAVEYNGQFYKRGKYFIDGEQKGQQIRILQVGSKFIFLDRALEFDGKRTIAEGSLVIRKGEKKA